MAVEEPKFIVSLHEGDYEIRDYQETAVAETTVPGERKSAARKGFRLLAGYIFGGNARRQAIAMTAPVIQTTSGDALITRFTMPSGSSVDGLPKANDSRVKLRTVAPARFAVLRFSGLASPARVAAKTAQLAAFTERRQLRTVGAVDLAQYNPPWTLWFMRRNEVMIQLAA